MDAAVLGFTFLMAVLTSLLSGTAPAARQSLAATLKEGGAPSTIGRGKQRLRSLLIVAQVAVSFLLLIGAGLMLRSFTKLQQVDPGFQPENILTMEVALDFVKYNTDDKQRAFFETCWRRSRCKAASNRLPFR
jgi:putative ABC transport system permease protein